MEFCKQKRSPKICQPRKPQSFIVEACSPHKPKEENYVLELKPFSSFPRIMFEKVRIGEFKLQPLVIRNPLTVPQSVCIEKFPVEKGFSISEVRFHIQPLSEIELKITWKPDKVVSCRETVLFRSSTGTRAQAYLHGTACSPKKQKRKKWDDKCIDQKIVNSSSKNEKEEVFQEKENINVLNSKGINFEDQWKKPDFLPKKPTDLSDSPVRRQTYIIDSLCKPNQIKTLIQNETFCSADNGSKFILGDEKVQHESQMKGSFTSDCFSFPKEIQTVHNTVEIFDDSLENNLIDTSLELDENDQGPQRLTCNSQVDFNRGKEKNFDFPFTESLDKTNSNWGNNIEFLDESCKIPTNVQIPFYLGSNDFSESTKHNVNFAVHNLTNDQSTVYDSEARIVHSENVKLLETRKDNIQNLIPEFKVPQCFNMKDPLTVKERSSSIAFEIKPGRLHSGTSLSPAKLIDKSKRKTMIISNKKLQSTELREKLFSTSLSINEKVKVKTPHRKVDKVERRLSKFLPKRLTLTKIKASDKVCQRNPFATSNAYYDQYWMEKQEMAFTNWLNFILTPNDDFHLSEEIQVNSAEIWMESMKDAVPIHVPSKEELSFKTYTAAKQLNRLRKAACQLYQSEELSETIKRTEKEVDLKKLSIRSDRAIHADLGIKKDMLEMLLSYNPLWLRIGLETVYGEMISLQNNRDIVGLSRFIINRYLSNPELVAKYAHSSVINYFKPGFEEKMKSFTLKKFLLLVYFLDVAKRRHLIEHNPCLFSKTSKYKSSRDLLITFSREYLNGEGDITKHLRYLGYIVKHQQMPIEEFDYAVKNIAVDLRCGLRLGRAVELLLQDWSISKSLRANTLNRLTKIYNNDFIIKALQISGIEIEGNIDPRDIVDGNREKTLSLLWQIIFKTQVSRKVNLEALKKENSYLRRSLKLKADCAAFDATMSQEKGECFEYDFFNSKLYKENEVIQQLFQWCQNVCAHYGVKVYNFTSSFSDGRALCFLLHHYHPNLLPINLIKLKTTSSYFEEQMENLEDENCPFLPESKQMKPKAIEECLKNEKGNLDVALQKAQEIGQIPILSFPTHLSNTLPDEKVIITFISYINIRLMELSVEIRAARTILYAYRKWRLHKRQKELQVKIAAAAIILRYWRKYRERKLNQLKEKSANTIQRIWRLYSAKKQLEVLKNARLLKRLNYNATLIQAAFKGYKTRKHLEQCKKSCVILQSYVRKWLARSQFLKLRQAVIKVQSIYRARVLGKFHRQRYLCLKKRVILLQAYIRGVQLREKLRSQTSAVVLLQSNIRMWLARKHYLRLKKTCICVQERFRSLLLMREKVKCFQKARQSAIIIQRWYLAIKKRRFEHESAVKIQCWFKQVKEKKKYRQLRSAIVTIQLWWKAVYTTRTTRSMYVLSRKKVILLQACFRKVIAKRAFEKKRKSAIIIQKNVRKIIQRKCFYKIRSSAATVQRWWRNILLSRQVRNKYLMYRDSIIKIQSFWRMCNCRKSFRETKYAASIIERYRKGKAQRAAFLHLRKQCLTIQSSFRGYICRKEYNAQKKAVILIQSCVRSYLARKEFLKKKKFAIKIQQHYRDYKLMCRDKRNYKVMKSGFTRLQATYRGINTRSEIKCLQQKACLIQKYYKGYIARKHYLELKRACTVVQQKFRANILMKTQVQKYQEIKRSIILIQATLRCISSKKSFLKQKRAAIKIQSYVRMIIARKSYLHLYQNVVFIQRAYRAKCSRNFQVNVYSETRRRIIYLQSKVRCFVAKRNYLKMKTACILIQSVVRMWLIKARFTRLCNAATIIQTRYRSLQTARTVKKDYLALKSATVKIQSAYRGKKELLKYRKIRNTALFIQEKFRAKLACRKARQEYLVKRSSSVKIQSFVRMNIARRNFLKIHNASIAIQSIYRMYTARKNYLKIKNAACIVQKHFQAWKIGSKQRKEFLKMKHSAIVVQSCYRGFVLKRKFDNEKKACITIQAHIRRFIAQKNFLMLKNAAITIQKTFKAFLLGREIKKEYQIVKSKIIFIQALVKGWLVRRKIQKLHCFAMQIQKTYKAYICRKNFLIKKKSVVIIQKIFKSYLLRKRVNLLCLKLRNSATIIQSAWRGYNTRKDFKRKYAAVILLQSQVRKVILRKQYIKIQQSAVTIQRRFHAYKLGSEQFQLYRLQKTSCILIQSVWRAFKAKREFKRKYSTIILLQSLVRKVLVQKQYNKIRQSAVIIQQRFRAYKLGSEQFQLYRLQKTSCILIQSVWRAFKAKREFKRKYSAIILLQSLVRKVLVQKQYNKIRQSTVIIQERFRAYKLGSEQYQLYRRQKTSCILIQSVWRAFKAKTEFKRKVRAAVILQSQVRKLLLRRKFLAMRSSAVIIQRHYLAYRAACKELDSYLIKRKSCIKIQAAWRGFATRKHFNEQRRAVMCIQKHYRKRIQRRKEQESLGSNSNKLLKWYTQLHANLVEFQKHARHYLQRREKSAVLIQSYYRMWLAKRQFKKMKAVVKIQALWRGYETRKKVTDPRILAVKQNLKKCAVAKKNILKNRTTSALETLITCKNLRVLLIALQELDICTQLSPTCCERLEQSEGLSVIIDLVRSCNRSVPHKELIKVSTNILVNIAKYKKTVNSIWSNQKALITILDLMKIYRDNGQDIFTKCCTLFYIFCHDPQKAKDLQNSPVFCEQIKSFHHLLMRKLSLEEKRSKSSASSQTFIKRWVSSTSRESLPIDPDWLLGHHRKRSFKDPYTAISALMHVLDLQPKVS